MNPSSFGVTSPPGPFPANKQREFSEKKKWNENTCGVERVELGRQKFPERVPHIKLHRNMCTRWFVEGQAACNLLAFSDFISRRGQHRCYFDTVVGLYGHVVCYLIEFIPRNYREIYWTARTYNSLDCSATEFPDMAFLVGVTQQFPSIFPI